MGSTPSRNHRLSSNEIFWSILVWLLCFCRASVSEEPVSPTIANASITFNFDTSTTYWDSVSDNGTAGYYSGRTPVTEPLVPLDTTSISDNDTFLDVVDDFEEDQGEKIIFLQGLFEISNCVCRDHPLDGKSELTAVKLAIEDVNSINLIPGYKLEMYDNDTECDAGVAVDKFFYALFRCPQMTMLLGPANSDTTERLARVVNYKNVLQLSFGALSPALSDQKNYPFFYRIVSPDISHHAARVHFIQYFQWDTVATIFEDNDEYTLPINALISDLESANISVPATISLTEQDFEEHLKELKDKDYRIIVGSFSNALLRKVFCEVYKLGMYGSDYVWLLTEPEEKWWRNGSGTGCTSEELSQAAEGYFTVSRFIGSTRNITSLSGLTLSTLKSRMSTQITHISPFVAHAYDSVWAVCLVLREANRIWRQKRHRYATRLEHFNYTRPDMVTTFSRIIEELQFEGVSGPILFRGSDRIGTTAFYHNQNGIMKHVALFYPQNSQLDFHCPTCQPVYWKDNEVPVAKRTLVLRIATLHHTVFVIIATLASLGMAMAIAFLAFNLYFRRRKYIKLSSPNLNNIAVVGCVLVYVGVVLLGLDHGTLREDNHFNVVCTARAFLFSGGFSLAFGSMFIKTYRVHHIFIRANSGIIKTKLLQDQQLIVLIGVLILIDCIIVTVWVTVDPMERSLCNLTRQVSKVERDVVYLLQREQCQSSHMAKWLGLLYAYKGLLLAVGCYMAWETRHVKIPALNDSQYIGINVYNVVLTSVLVVALANVISAERYVLTFLLVTSLILISTTTTLCILFVPKILTLIRNPSGDAVVASTGVKVTEHNTRRFLVDEQREVLYRAEVQNRVYQRELMELEQEVVRLKTLIGMDNSTTVTDNSSVTDEDDDPDVSIRSSLLEKNKRSSVSWDIRDDPRAGHYEPSTKKRLKGKTLHISKLYSVKKPPDPSQQQFCLGRPPPDKERQLRGSLPAIMLPLQHHLNLVLQQTGSYPALSPSRCGVSITTDASSMDALEKHKVQAVSMPGESGQLLRCNGGQTSATLHAPQGSGLFDSLSDGTFLSARSKLGSSIRLDFAGQGSWSGEGGTSSGDTGTWNTAPPNCSNSLNTPDEASDMSITDVFAMATQNTCVEGITVRSVSSDDSEMSSSVECTSSERTNDRASTE